MTGYARQARLLHWLIAILVLALLVVGTLMVRVGFGVATTFALYNAHKSFGLLVLLAMLARTAIRLRNRPPPLPYAIPLWRHKAAAGVHGFLYIVLIALPVTGWLSASAAPLAFPFLLFGLIEVPHLAALATMPYEPRVAIYATLSLVHRGLAWSLAVAIVLHVVGALYPAQHRRAVLARMWPPR